jgi:hypothetical protein
MTEQQGRADLHIHTLASDGTSGIAEILDYVQEHTTLDVIAITDHERIDAAVAAQAMAPQRGLRFEVVVGEEITTRSGHLLGLFLERPVRPFQSLSASVRQVHEQGGLAIAAHPLVPYPLCISGRRIRALMAHPDPALHLDGLETFNPTGPSRPWRGRVAALREELGIAGVGNSDAHIAHAVGKGWTGFAGSTAADLRAAIEARATSWHGQDYGTRETVGTFARQVRKYSRDVRDELLGLARRRSHGRDLGYPGGRQRPARYVETEPLDR